MSARRVLAGSAVALLLPASLLLTVETGSATDSAARPASTSVTKKASQKISLEVLPQIVQQGKRTASADSAKAAVTATIKPVKVGRKVVLEQLNGSSWKKVGTAKQEKSGRANFSAVVSKGGAAADLPRHRAEVQGPQEGLQHLRRHDAVADPDLHRRVLRQHPQPGVGHARPEVRAAEQAQVLQG